MTKKKCDRIVLEGRPQSRYLDDAKRICDKGIEVQLMMEMFNALKHILHERKERTCW